VFSSLCFQFDITFTVVDKGIVCPSTESNYLLFTFDGSSHVEDYQSKSQFSFSLNTSFDDVYEDQSFVVFVVV
jgi:hypothetical protein